MPLNTAQRRQIELQVKAHAIPWKYKINVPRAVSNPVLRGLVMFPGVLQPLSSGHFGRFLYDNPQLYDGKRVLDMGCGSGALGIIMAQRGAKRVILSDVDQTACDNTRENIRLLRVAGCCEVVQSNLFENITEKFGLIIFAHPYFGDPPILPAIPVTRGMLDDGQLINRFLDMAKPHLAGPILMPYLVSGRKRLFFKNALENKLQYIN
jgi:SAM-dependent methyltransferase